MSSYGLSEALRWDSEIRQIFFAVPPAVVTDDLVSFQTVGGFDATVQYQGGDFYKMTPEFIPGRSVWFHEFEHRLHWRAMQRVGDSHEAELLKGIFSARGADPALVDANRNLAKEQAASMFAEEFAGQWGGYQHPCPDVPVPLGLRLFFLGIETWLPTPVLDVPIVTVPVSNSAPHIEWIGMVPNTNFAMGRSGNPITLIVDHWTDASLESAVARFQRYDERLSAHYIVGQTGRIVQMVREEDTAYHAGKLQINYISIGIEHEASPTLPPTDKQYAASAWLHARLAAKYGIRLEEGVTVLPHKAIVPTACPGTLSITRILEEADMTEDQLVRIENKLNGVAESVATYLWRLQHNLDVKTGAPRST